MRTTSIDSVREPFVGVGARGLQFSSHTLATTLYPKANLLLVLVRGVSTVSSVAVGSGSRIVCGNGGVQERANGV